MDDRREDPPPGKSLGSWRGLVPIGVAAAAALFIGGTVDVVQSRQRDAKKEEAKAAVGSEEAKARFVVGVTASGGALVVRDVETGAGVGLPVAAPEGRRFQRVAAVKDGSYIVASYAGGEVTFHRLHLGGEGRPKDMQDIPKATVPGKSTKWSELAVSPDGERIAYVTYQGARGRVDVVSASTGTHKVWTTKSSGRIGSLSWSGATLSFVWGPVRSVGGELKETKHEVRTLDTGGATGDLKLSKAVLTLPKGSNRAILKGDTIVAGIVKNSQLTLQSYTLEGKPGQVLWQQPVKGELTDLDADPTGNDFLATAGDLYTEGAKAVPGEDLADASW
ncbi:hypothetical protein [Actinomadura sp. 7K507]|uniref:hypothetical protein n=1 Tax=Actinomadura sp. 7K507 TaxID=2530365 RepID=UPI00104A9134|nr:hypothetical protein [Actinomadura sp. 7K507]TDC81760.1 hypothetical protein E1285_32030 [Actinomadura sp. 7K507]